MPKQEFEVTQGLLEDDMRRQAGSIEKSWLEAVMNSVDAGASKFEISIKSDHTNISDDGSGMDKEEIEMYFKQFGYKDTDVEDKTFGRFRRGRGQIFNFGKVLWYTQDNVLVVNLDSDEARYPKEDVDVDLNNADSDVWVDGDEIVFNTEGLGFNQQPINSYVDGTEIWVDHYSEITSPEEKVGEFQDLAKYIPWLHDIEIYVNNEEIDSDFNANFETEYAYYSFDASTRFGSSTYLYNLGAFVDTVRVKDNNGDKIPVNSIVVTKDELQLNNARTEVIDGCSVWNQVKDDLVEGVKQFLSSKNDLNSTQNKWLIKQASQDDILFEDIKDRNIIEDVSGNNLSLSDLKQNDFAFAPEGNAVAEEAMDRKGILMVNDSYRDAITTMSSSESSQVPEGRTYEDVVDQEMEYEMKEWNESKLSKRRKTNLDKIRWFLKEIGCYDDVKPGHSKHEDVWRIDSDTILVDKDFLNANKNKFVTHVIDKVVSIAAYDGDTRGGFRKDTSYNRQYQRYMSKTAQPRQDLMTGNFSLTDRLVLE